MEWQGYKNKTVVQPPRPCVLVLSDGQLCSRMCQHPTRTQEKKATKGGCMLHAFVLPPKRAWSNAWWHGMIPHAARAHVHVGSTRVICSGVEVYNQSGAHAHSYH